MTQTRRAKVSCTFQNNGFNDVRNVFTLVGRIFEMLVDLFPLDDKYTLWSLPQFLAL